MSRLQCIFLGVDGGQPRIERVRGQQQEVPLAVVPRLHTTVEFLELAFGKLFLHASEPAHSGIDGEQERLNGDKLALFSLLDETSPDTHALDVPGRQRSQEATDYSSERRDYGRGDSSIHCLSLAR
jgi:hypothetical protein